MTMSSEELTDIYEMEEGLEHHIYQKYKTAHLSFIHGSIKNKTLYMD